jgi:hypothetical protein
MATNDIRRAANIDIKYNIREQFVWVGTVTDAGGSAVDLSGKTLLYSVRKRENSEAVLTASTASEIVVSGANNNVITITIATPDLTERTYYHDLENTTDNKMIFDGKLQCTFGAYGT